MSKLTRQLKRLEVGFWLLILAVAYSIFRESTDAFMGTAFRYIADLYQKSNDKLSLIVAFLTLVGTLLGVVIAYLALRRQQ